MFRRRLLAVTIPLLTVGVVVGAGFSAWYFNLTPDTVQGNVGVVVTSLVTNVGEVTFKVKTNGGEHKELAETDKIQVVLDQVTGTNSHANDRNNVDRGISF